MTPEEAYKELKDSIAGYDYQYHMETHHLAIEAVKKQVPKKPRQSEGEYYVAYFCPECKECVPINGAYCMTCGQALDWKGLDD